VDWAGAEAAIKTILEALSITSPITQTIARVYIDPPATLQDAPAFLMTSEITEHADGPWGCKIVYLVHLQLLLRDEDQAQAGAIVKAYRAALVTAFHSHLALSGTVEIATSPLGGKLAGLLFAGIQYVGAEFTLTVMVMSAPTFGT
jgi:hypothetical protein